VGEKIQRQASGNALLFTLHRDALEQFQIFIPGTDEHDFVDDPTLDNHLEIFGPSQNGYRVGITGWGQIGEVALDQVAELGIPFNLFADLKNAGRVADDHHMALAVPVASQSEENEEARPRQQHEDIQHEQIAQYQGAADFQLEQKRGETQNERDQRDRLQEEQNLPAQVAPFVHGPQSGT